MEASASTCSQVACSQVACSQVGRGSTAVVPHGEFVVMRAESRLRESGYAALRDLQCRYHEGVLFASGVVPSFYLKQVVYASVKDIEGVEIFVDQVEVRTTH